MVVDVGQRSPIAAGILFLANCSCGYGYARFVLCKLDPNSYGVDLGLQRRYFVSFASSPTESL